MMASVSGIFTRKVVPSPRRLRTSTLPPIRSMFVRTTSMPTPRPETFVTRSAVEKPGRKMRSRISRSLRRVAWSGPTKPRSSALANTRSGSIPAPSSVISMFTWPPSWNARTSRRPSAGFPAASRASGASIPWSTALRTRCVSGSLIASMIERSSSVSSPSISIRTRFPHATARSRTTRGNLLQTLPIGCIRVFITPSWSSVVMRFSRCAAAVRTDDS
ncbi:MAG: hypothetical protein KatS3mg014_2559 [Actinomycetota bacterium]|nr:MAG: hypothetical protein KatS3mg014_2559 [Actinomycetota bacterium]